MANFFTTEDTDGNSHFINVDTIIRLEKPKGNKSVWLHLVDGKTIALTHPQAEQVEAKLKS